MFAASLAKERVRTEYASASECWGAAGLAAAETPWETEAVILVPRFVKEMIAAQERCACDKAPNLTIAQWLHALPPALQRRERLRALHRLGLVVL